MLIRPLAIALALLAAASSASSLCAESTVTVQRPIPDIASLMHEVEAHQKQLDVVREDYTYHEKLQRDELDGNGQVKKSETFENEVFFVNTHRIERTGEEGRQAAHARRREEGAGVGHQRRSRRRRRRPRTLRCMVTAKSR